MNTKQKIITIVCSASILLSACASTSSDKAKKPDSNMSILDNIQKSLDSSAQQKPSAKTGQLPTSVTDALLPMNAISMPTGKVEKIEPRFDISVDHADARQFFVSLTSGLRINNQRVSAWLAAILTAAPKPIFFIGVTTLALSWIAELLSISLLLSTTIVLLTCGCILLTSSVVSARLP